MKTILEIECEIGQMTSEYLLPPNEMTLRKRLLDYVNRLLAESAKETAKEILQSMNTKMNMLTGCGVPYHVKRFMKEIAKQYGVEVDK